MRLVVAMTGATGAVLGIRALQALGDLGVETHLVVSRWARATIAHETCWELAEVTALASVVHGPDEESAPIAGGSFRPDGMIVVPCSMKTAAGVRAGLADGLVGRAADVTLAERRPLVLVARETPLSEVHLENLLALTRMGASVVPPVPAFYNHPKGVDDVVDHAVGRTLDQLGLSLPETRRWGGFRDGRAGAAEG